MEEHKAVLLYHYTKNTVSHVFFNYSQGRANIHK